MKLLVPLLLSLLSVTVSAQDVISTRQGELTIHPVQHATLVMEWQGNTIYVDPHGDAGQFADLPAADLLLITDIHGDHFNRETLQVLDLRQAHMIVPEAVRQMMEGIEAGKVNTLKNGEQRSWNNIQIEAMPMYNLPETADSRHPKGRGNGYVLTLGGKKIYISGDTEDISEMRNLKDIDIAFVCMNLPYTMSVEQAADAVLEFRPRIVYPYHYRGGGGQMSDVEAFKKQVESQSEHIEVRLRNWYP